jgi:hypothetical protein
MLVVREEKRADDDVLFTSDSIRCVGPDSVVENHGAADVAVADMEDNDVTSEIRGASSKGVVATVAFVHELISEKEDGGIGRNDTPTPSPAIRRNVPGVIRDSARILRNSKDEESGR